MRKVVLVGAGAVGAAYAYSLVNQGYVSDLVIIDANETKAEGEAMDLAHGLAYAPNNMRLKAGNYVDCSDAQLVVITAGANQKPGETRLQLVEKNASIARSIVKEVIQSGFKGIFLVASNPVDILTQVVQQASGFPTNRVIGSGTTLDSARLKVMLGEQLEVDPHSIHALMIGEHGDSELPVWSQARVGSEPLSQFLRRKGGKYESNLLAKIADRVRNSAYEIINRKGVTNFGIGMALMRLTKAIFNDENCILPVSCLLTNDYGENNIFMSVPAIIGRAGIKEVIELQLHDEEKQLFAKSAEALRKASEGVF